MLRLPGRQDRTASPVTAPLLRSSAMAFADGMINGTLVASVAGNALTIAIKTLAGNDPSGSDPVYVLFRSATAANGDFSVLTITAATSLVVSSGSTLGAVNSTPFSLWVVGFNDAGTFRLGVINCVVGMASTSAMSITPLDEYNTYASTAEGGAGAADSAGVFYTGAAVSAKAFRILGWMHWGSGLATVGTWASGPTRIQLHGAGSPLPGAVVQSKWMQITSVTTVTTSAFVDTALLNTISPTKASNLVRASYCAVLDAVFASDLGLSRLHRGSTGIGPTGAIFDALSTASEGITTVSGSVLDAPGTTASTTYSVRIANALGSHNVNLPPNTNYPCTMLLEEIMA